MEGVNASTRGGREPGPGPGDSSGAPGMCACLVHLHARCPHAVQHCGFCVGVSSAETAGPRTAAAERRVFVCFSCVFVLFFGFEIDFLTVLYRRGN